MSEDMYDPKANDQLTKQRGICMTQNCHVRAHFNKLKECQQRLIRKPYTAETCHEETVDLIQAIDHCIGDKAFVKIA